MSLHELALTPLQSLGIPVALVGSLFLAVGSELQQHGVSKVERSSAPRSSKSLGIRQVFRLAKRPSWLLGGLLLALAIVFQLVSLWLAPLTVVQPLGVTALVATALIDARVSKKRLTAPAIRALVLCVAGVAIFVVAAALTTASRPIQEMQLIIVLALLLTVLIALGVVFGVLRARLGRIFYVVGAGVLFGFVATLAKVLVTRLQVIFASGFQSTVSDWLTVACLVGLLITAPLGAYFVQAAYSSGSPDVVVAGLTVIDPLVGVTIGIVVLGEATSAPIWAVLVFLVGGVLAIFGVVQLSRRHPAERYDHAEQAVEAVE